MATPDSMVQPVPAGFEFTIEKNIPIPARERSIRPIPNRAFHNLRKWHRQALQFEKTPLPSDLPDNRLLLSDWLRGPEIELADDPTFIVLTLDKPSRKGQTRRYVDPAAMFVFLVHCIAGGSIRINPSGSLRKYYYPRLWLSTRGAYVSRLIVGTLPRYLTMENADFHDLRRSALGRLRSQTEEGPGAKNGREQATQWTQQAVNGAIKRGDDIPAGVDENLVAQWLGDGYRLLDKVPLGSTKSQNMVSPRENLSD